MGLIDLETLTPDKAQGLFLCRVMPVRDGQRRALGKGQTLVLTHIPRTGGITLDAILYAVAAAAKLPWVRLAGDAYAQYWGGKKAHVLDSARANADAIRSANLVSGHMPYGIHEQADKECIYATVLRDPVARAWSQVRRIARDDPSIASLTITEILERGYLVDNQQVRMIAGCMDATIPCDEDMLMTARNVLQNAYALVGVMDDFDRFISVLASGLGWPQLLFRTRNASQALAASPPEADAELLRQHSHLDERLYRYASDIRRGKEHQFMTRFIQGQDGTGEADSPVLFSLEPYALSGQPIGFLPAGKYAEISTLLTRHRVSVRDITL